MAIVDEHKVRTLVERLKDDRSKKVVFVAHCLLNENARYLGGAFRPGCVNEVVDELQRQGMGIVQMPCPEQKAWGGVLKKWVLLSFGIGDTWLYKLKGLFMPLVVWNTKRVFGRIARRVIREIKEYQDAGFEVVGIIGVDCSPSCGVDLTVDMDRSFEVVAGLDLETLDRETVNERVYADCVVEGKGWFIKALRKELGKAGLEIGVHGHDLIAEMKGERVEFEI